MFTALSHFMTWFAMISVLLLASSSSAEIRCYECHGTKIDSSSGDYRPIDAPYRNISTGGFPGSHRSHMAAPSTPDACSKCHPGSQNYSSGHRNGIIGIAFNINSSPSPGKYYAGLNPVVFRNQSAISTLGTCSGVNCHFESPTPRWGKGGFEGENKCASCHGAPPNNDSTHAKHHNAYGSTTASCARCHTDHAKEAAPFAHASSAGKRGVSLKIPTYSLPDNISYPKYLPSQLDIAERTGSCTNIYCHSNGDGGAPTVVPAWMGNLPADCSGCHGGNLSSGHQIATGSHNAHIKGNRCAKCHRATVSEGDDRIITNASKHIDGVKTLEFSNGISYVPSAKSCSSVSCHGNTGATWGGAGACLDCHSVKQGTRSAITGQFASSSHHVQGGAITNAHCYQCHWEANSDGSINSEHHQGGAAPGSSIELVVYGDRVRPGTFEEEVSAVRYTANGQRGEIQKINSHCLGCHNDRNSDVSPFSDGKTPKQYAWDGTSVEARYGQTGTTRWGKYSTANGANKRVTKAYSAHGNAVANARGWNAATGVDGAIADTSGGVNVQCFDCHNSHGSSASGITSRYSSATGRKRGGILKDTTIANSGYSVAYRPYTGGSTANKNRRNPGASICLDCHMNQGDGSTPWGYSSTFGASKPILGYWDLPFMGISTSGAERRFPYKKLNTRSSGGGHFGSMNPLSSSPTSTIDGLCTPCHDPHGVSPNTTATGINGEQQYAVPLLKGTWVTSPYREDKAPEFNEPLTARSDQRAFAWRSINTNYKIEGIPYNIDQNTFGSDLATSVNGIDVGDDKFAGLCKQCHPKESLTGATHTWKSKDRIHESVKGWKPAGTVKHQYSCSKCHSAHTSSVLPRLMVTNCMDSKHKGRTGWGIPVVEARSWGQIVSGTAFTMPNCDTLSRKTGFCSSTASWSGSGHGRIPGSYHGDDPHTGDHNVACHEVQNDPTGNESSQGYGTSQGWNNVTPWYPALAITSGPTAYTYNGNTTIYFSANIEGGASVRYGLTSAYGSIAYGNILTSNHSITFPNSSSIHYQLIVTSRDGQQLTSQDYVFDITAPYVTSFSPETPSPGLTIPIRSFTGSDNVGIAGYLITTTSSQPSKDTYGWSATKPESYAVPSLGTYMLYPWVKDAAGNVSSLFGMGVQVTAADLTPPSGLANLAPPDNSVNLPANTRVSCSSASDSQSSQLQYLFQVSTDIGFTADLQQSGWQSGTTYAPVLAANTTYYWRAKARDGASTRNESPFTSPWSFRTGTAALWTYKGDFENNLNTTNVPHPAAIVNNLRVSGSIPTDDASVSNAYKGLAGGSDHTLAVRSDGTLWAWGNNTYGQLGTGTTTGNSSPAPVAGLSGITATAAGNGFSLALKGSDGSVLSWGSNSSGQLGDGSTTQKSAPVQVKMPDNSDLTGIIALAAGTSHALALKGDGTVWAWGGNSNGQLGNNTFTNSSNPVQVKSPDGSGYLTDIIAVAAGDRHSLAVKSDGTVWSWGWNGYSQLGDPVATRNLPGPVRVSANSSQLNDVVAVAAGMYYSVALKSDGTVWIWGYGSGDGTITYRNMAVQVKSPDGGGYLNGIVAVAAGSEHTLALKSDGTVWGWGKNDAYQLGDTTTTLRNLPVQVVGMDSVGAITAGGGYSIALKSSDGSVWGWGFNSNGQLGTGQSGTALVPVQVQGGFSGAAAISMGYSHSVAYKSDGTVWSWGNNSSGQLGDGTTLAKSVPVTVAGLSGVGAVAAWDTISLAVRTSDGTVWSWGSGYLGTGGPSPSSTPGQVKMSDGSNLTGAASVKAGSSFLMVLKSDRTVWGWGNNYYGQLGTGNNNESLYPVQVSGLTGATSLATGSYHALALKSDNTVWSWGNNESGQLGNGTITNSNIPVQVKLSGGGNLTGVVAVSSGGSHSLAVKSDGTVWAWGYNGYGQLGNGSTSNSSYPVQVTGLTGIIAVAAGTSHSLALKSDGTVWSWGYNYYGQLGDGTNTNRLTPVKITGFSGISRIAAGSNSSQGIAAANGTVWAWGDNYYSQLGTGYARIQGIPVQSMVSGLPFPSGTLSGLKVDAGSPALWENISWNSLAGGDAPTIRFRSRSANSEQDLALASWSVNYADTGAAIASPASQWLELELTILGSGILRDVAVTYHPQSQTADITPPVSTVIAPADGSVINLSSGSSYTISGTATDSERVVQRIEVGISDGISETWHDADCTTCLSSSASWNYTWSIPAAGNYTIRTRATDSAGNTESPGPGNAVTAVYATDSFPPSSTISSPLPGSTLVPAALNPYPVSGSASDHVAVQGVEISTDGGIIWQTAVCSGCPGNNVTWNYSWTLPANGSFTVKSRAIDSAGNRETPGTGIGVTTVSIPAAPAIGAATALSPTSIRWNFTDNSDNETGFKLHDSYQVIKASSATPDINNFVENGLTANTLYTRHLHVYNAAGDSPASGEASRWTLPLPANVTVDKAASSTVWYNSSVFTFTNAATFGGGGVKGYRYSWDQNPAATTYGSTWESGTLAKTATAAGSWYLHIQPYNGENVPNGNVDLGPFNYDGTPPVLATFTAGAAGDQGVPVTMTATDNLGVTGYLITTYSSPPSPAATDWSAAAPAYFTTLGSYTLYPWARDAAGNVSAIFSSPYSVTVPPLGVINLSPANDGINNQSLPTDTSLSCTAASNAPYSSAVQYFFQISTDSAFAPGATQESGWLERLPAGIGFAPALLPNTTYYWRVKARQSSQTANESPFSATWTFTTANTVLWTYKGDFENNARTVASATTRDAAIQVTGIAPGDDAAVTTHYRRISSHGGHVLTINKVDGTVLGWGLNSNGQLGNNSIANSLSPVKASSISNVVAVAAGQSHSLALKSDGSVWAWGLNSYGQLGNGTTTGSSVPVPVTGLGSGVVAIAAGNNHSLALKANGTVWAWGDGNQGQLGYGISSSIFPVQVKDSGGIPLTGITTIAGKFNGGMAIDSDGYAWGWGSAGPPQSSVPRKVTLPSPAMAVAPGSNHALVLLSDGSVWGWGPNYNNELGNTGSNGWYSPVRVNESLGSSVVSIAAGEASSHALKADGTVWSWGSNATGQFGNNSTANSPTPVQMQGLTGKIVSVIDAGSGYSMLVASDGTVYGAGKNDSGQLGNGSAASTVALPAQGIVSGLTSPSLKAYTFKVDAGSAVAWSRLSWHGTTLGNSGVRLRTRGADTDGGLSTVTWSPEYAVTGLPIVNAQGEALVSRWLEIEATLESKTDSVYPRIEDISATWTGSPAVTDLTVPTVVSVAPANGSVGVDSDSPVTITWSENIDCSTVDTTTVTINPPVGWAKTSCSGSQAVFAPSGQISTAASTYTVTVSSAIKDTAGNAMSANKIVSYSTIPYGSVGNWKFEEGSGTIIKSSTGSNHGTIGGAYWSIGKRGLALQSPGGMYVTIGSSGFPSGAGDRTIEAWVKTTGSGILDILSYGTAASGQGMTLGLNGGAAYVSAITSPQYSTGNLSLNNGNWHHIVFVLASGTAQVYVDGVLKDARGFAPNTVLNLAKIGTRMDGSSEYWNGSLDEIIVYNRALTCPEILSQYRRFGDTGGACP